MASKKTLNAKNLETLGAARLAELLIEISSGDATAKRRLRLELAGTFSPKEAAREIRKRITQIGRAQSFVDWRKRRALIKDLDAQRHAIVEKVMLDDPAEALDLMWRFLALANPVFGRCDDSSGTVIHVFHTAVENLAEIAAAASPAPDILADRMFTALQDNGYGQYDDLIATLVPVLGETGLAHLKTLVEALDQAPVTQPAKDEEDIIGWGSDGPVYAREIAETSRKSTVDMALRDIADAQGDVDAYLARYDAKTRRLPGIAASIATRLLAADRAEEALEILEAAETDGRRWVPQDWHHTRLEVLEGLGRGEEAQEQRWSEFERQLSTDDLRAFLKRLPDFEDVEAEDRALDHAGRHPDLLLALSFLIQWPAHDRAAALILERSEELDGNHYEYLSPAADALSERHPLAATCLLRAMIDFTLNDARSSRYKHAARHLVDCVELAARIEDYGVVSPHDDYLADLRTRHFRKSGFWARVGELL
ncbi:DUF6880 family protein [Leisingera sp. JC11]|uniref:DUF6880 family protein n=1 Tax=Leisingera sp. JC11 TaxID=3042469 RepID=UPI0034513408